MDFPFQANITSGAKAFNPTGTIGWGAVPDNMLMNVTVIDVIGDKYKIGSPLWSNDKVWTVRQIYVTQIDDTEPPDEEVPTIFLKHIIEVYSDGSLFIDGNPYP